LDKIYAIQAKGYEVGGVNVLFAGDIPSGGGMSSSAALTCGFIYALSTIFNLNIPSIEIAKIAQAAEHCVGIKCGLMDQFASLFGKENQVIQLDCRDLSYQYFPLELKDYQLVLINTKVKHELVNSEYNDRRASCEMVLETIQKDHSQIQTLRDITKDLLAQYEGKINQKDLTRVRFVAR
jgi:galactokinase